MPKRPSVHPLHVSRWQLSNFSGKAYCHFCHPRLVKQRLRVKTKTESGKCFCIRVVWGIKLRSIVMSTNLDYRERERQRTRESSATGQRSSTRKWARVGEKKKETFFVVGTTWNFVAAGLAATEGENGRQWKKVNKNTSDISSIKRVTRKFMEVSRCNRAKQRQRNVQKKSAALLLFFHRSRSLQRLALHVRLYILFEQIIKIIESFAFSPS